MLAAGELRLDPAGAVVWISNYSSGYCPDPSCFGAVRDALQRLAITAPASFDHAVIFRRCEACGQRCVVKDADYTCAVCDAVLPAEWNFVAR